MALRLSWLAFFFITSTVLSCGRSENAGVGQFVAKIEAYPVSDRLGADDVKVERTLERADSQAMQIGVTAASQAVGATVTLKKKALFDRQFLYGFDLQYSSQSDPQEDLYSQSMAIGHLPCFFRKLGDTLQLVGDQSRHFESVVNHPEVLLNEYRIVSEDDETMVVSFLRGGMEINQVVNGKTSPAPKESWIRSVEYVADANLLLQESALMLQDGSVMTFMESVLPRERIVPDGYVGLENSPDVEPLAERYRFLSDEKVFVGRGANGAEVREETSFADRFNLGEKGTIDFYVTANIPDKFLPVLKSGVEGWNRYFHPQLGRDVTRFMGRLPAGIKLGDPRFNVVNWDSVAMAGAAYESQATDPTTGIQSHSLIYMPYAWYNIATQLWKMRTEAAVVSADELQSRLAPKSPEVLFGKQKRILHCMRSTEEAGVPLQIMLHEMGEGIPALDMSLDEFGMRLMTTTLFHEMGHALGFAHNFKGSLSFDGSKPIDEHNMPTWSIMDYNYYQLEMKLFNTIGETGGPSLEYDRQIVSQLYHHGADVTEHDPVVPACEDGEADATVGGVDPLCMRYDSEGDPSLAVQHAYDNIVLATGAHGVEGMTLTEALTSLKPVIEKRLSDSSTIHDVPALFGVVDDVSRSVGELINYYFASGAQSLRINLRNNGKALRRWSTMAVIEEPAYRSRVYDAMTKSFAWRQLPEVPMKALQELADVVMSAAAKNPVAGTNDAERTSTGLRAKASFDGITTRKISLGLSKLRTGIYSQLGYDPDNVFAVGLGSGGGPSGFEEGAANILAQAVVLGLDSTTGDVALFQSERLTAAAQLVTFKMVRPAVIEGAKTKLTGYVDAGFRTGNQDLVDGARGLLTKLQ